MDFRFVILVAAFIWSAAASAETAPMSIDTRETALAATLDLEFEDALAKGISGAVILDQDGKVALRAAYGWADAEKSVPFTTGTKVPTVFASGEATGVTAEDAYDTFRSLDPASLADGVEGWIVRRAEDGHLLQVSRTQTSDTSYVYIMRRPDDGTLLVLVSNCGAEAEPLRNRMLVSLRDYGKMPLTNMH